MITFQEIILRLQNYWNDHGCALLQPIDLEVGAGTSHTATFLRALGPEPWNAAYVQPSRRPKDGRYGENPNRLQHYYQYQVVLKPSPANIQDLYLGSLVTLGIDPRRNDIRFVEDDWENPTLGAWGLGWEVWLNGMEVTQFTYFQEVGGLPCRPVLGEITYGLERLAMYLQGRDNLYQLEWTPGLSYGAVYHQNEVEQSRYNFEHSNTAWLFQQFAGFESEAARLIKLGLALPGYEMVLKCSHTFNLLDARGAISVTERATTIGRIRTLARQVAQAYYDSRAALGFPMCQEQPGAAPCVPATPDLVPPGPGWPSSPLEAAPRVPAIPALEAGAPPLTAPLLLELLTEELPPKRLERMGEYLGNTLCAALQEQKFVDANAVLTVYAAPRRLALTLEGVSERQPDQIQERRGPAQHLARDEQGQPTPALLGFARSCALSLDQLTLSPDLKGQLVYMAHKVAAGQTLEQFLAERLPTLCANLPVAKVMRWGQGEEQFVRPVHGLVALHGSRVLPLELLGLKAGRTTQGHRFLAPAPLTLERATDYASLLSTHGWVLAGFAERRARIAAALEQAAGPAQVLAAPALLDEVTALVEWPVVYAGCFDPEFLEVPQECLILSMQQHQKYFPLGDATGRLLPRFLLVSNLETPDPQAIISGNERVLRARLADARFFFEQDRKLSLEERLPRLAQVVYHNRLGSMEQRVLRLERLAGELARALGEDEALARRAARLMKADLLTDMVGEFPELQGTMGRYYALHDGESEEIANAIAAHYHPRFAQDTLPPTILGAVLALSDKLESLVGIFGIGQVPTGDKDPFALRRAALGVLRILLETPLSLPLHQLVQTAWNAGSGLSLAADTRSTLLAFMGDRLRGLLRDRGYAPDLIEAVLDPLLAGADAELVEPNPLSAPAPDRLDTLLARLDALRSFQKTPAGAGLSAANKRIANLLRKAGITPGAGPFDPALSTDPTELALYQMVTELEPQVSCHLARLDFAAALSALATLDPPVNAFFTAVMVLCDDPLVRANHLALLHRLSRLTLSVAQLARLSG